jgi:PTS system galactitol-specific IIA component
VNELIKILKPEFIFLQKEVKTDVEILSYLANQLLEKGVVKESFKEAILLREREFPTGLPTEGAGVAIPHSEAKFVNENQVAITILAHPVAFQMMGMPENQVDVSIVFLLALKGAESHLEMLKQLMDLIQKPQVLRELIETKSKKEVIEIIQSFIGPEGKR